MTAWCSRGASSSSAARHASSRPSVHWYEGRRRMELPTCFPPRPPLQVWLAPAAPAAATAMGGTVDRGQGAKVEEALADEDTHGWVAQGQRALMKEGAQPPQLDVRVGTEAV
eukprot:1161985-Pelagomonas_calceolata.AAC.4